MTQSDLTVAALPIDIAFADRESNLAAARSMARELKAPAHILVLPELFSTGYVNDPEAMHKLAEDNSGPTMQAVRAIAAEHSCAVAGSFVARENDRVCNRAFLVGPDGTLLARYDKRHLFSMSR